MTRMSINGMPALKITVDVFNEKGLGNPDYDPPSFEEVAKFMKSQPETFHQENIVRHDGRKTDIVITTGPL